MNTFRFGLETEYMLVDTKKYQALWHDDVPFKPLLETLESINIDHIPSMNGIDPEEAHNFTGPYVVEGYHKKHESIPATDMFVKGVEIRTPVMNSIEECLNLWTDLYFRLRNTLKDKHGYLPVAISQHTQRHFFEAPQAGRKHHFWLWAKAVMSTFGPDINVSAPAQITDRIFSSLEDFESMVDYYAPALTALSAASPFFENDLMWMEGTYVKSVRTLRRSPFAPMIEPHLNENGRMEFKFFDMSNNREDFHAMFLCCVGLMLASELPGRSNKETRQRELQAVAIHGTHAPFVSGRILEFKNHILNSLKKYGFNTMPLFAFFERAKNHNMPATKMAMDYLASPCLKGLYLDRSEIIYTGKQHHISTHQSIGNLAFKHFDFA